ncbi:MAG: methyltransferase domain-containing protein [Vicingaceae bacterium]
MPDYSRRSTQEELLDEINLDRDELFQNLRELESINRLLGGHSATLKGLIKIIKEPDKTYRIVDFACGGGDTLRAIHRWAKRKKIKVELQGFDLLADAITYAEENSKGFNIKYEVADFNTFETKNCDIAICSLVCHHFYGEKLNAFLLKMHETANKAVIINDLHRHWFAYYSINFLTQLFSKSRLVKNDAKLSVLKGFTKKEWQSILKENGFATFHIEWVWAFRHLIVIER